MSNPLDGYSSFTIPIGPVYLNWFNFVPLTLPWVNDQGNIVQWYS